MKRESPGFSRGECQLVPFDLFFDGGMIENGILKATIRRTQKKDKVDLGVQLYKLVREPIGGVVIATGEVLPPT